MKYEVSLDNIRLDKYLSSVLEDSRSQILKMIKNGEVLVNGKIVKAGFILKKCDIIEINHVQTDDSVSPEKMNLDIVVSSSVELLIISDGFSEEFSFMLLVFELFSSLMLF